MNHQTTLKEPLQCLVKLEAWLAVSHGPPKRGGRVPKTANEVVALNKARGIVVSPEDEDLLGMIWNVTELGYAHRGQVIDGTKMRFSLHRLICARVHQRQLFRADIVDHINHLPRDNRRENLRIVDYQGNADNRFHIRPNKTGYRGVSKGRKNWEAYIKHRGKSFNLGTFPTAILAALAYDKASLELGRTDLNFKSKPLF